MTIALFTFGIFSFSYPVSLCMCVFLSGHGGQSGLNWISI